MSSNFSKYAVSVAFPIARRRDYCVAVCPTHGILVVRAKDLGTPCPKCTGKVTPEDHSLALAKLCDKLFEIRDILESDVHGGGINIVDEALSALCQV